METTFRPSFAPSFRGAPRRPSMGQYGVLSPAGAPSTTTQALETVAGLGVNFIGHSLFDTFVMPATATPSQKKAAAVFAFVPGTFVAATLWYAFKSPIPALIVEGVEVLRLFIGLAA